MRMALKRPSYAEIEALPEWLRGENLAGGLVVVSPRPAKPHLRAATRLCARIFRPFEDDEAAFSVRPDWICELLSPSTAVHDRVHKLPFSGRAGVSHAWLSDRALSSCAPIPSVPSNCRSRRCGCRPASRYKPLKSLSRNCEV